jgi:O-antigen/teichoic acid export membrane protein
MTLFASASALGIYVVATALGTVVALVPGAIAMVLYPKSIRLSTSELRETVSRLFLIGLVVALTAAPIIAIALPQLIPLFFGKAFTGAVPVAEVLVVGYLLRGYAGMLVAILRGGGRPLRASIGEMVGLIVFAGCLLLLTRRFGSMGTAAALTVSAGVNLSWLTIQACTISGINLVQLRSCWEADIRLFAKSARRGLTMLCG